MVALFLINYIFSATKSNGYNRPKMNVFLEIPLYLTSIMFKRVYLNAELNIN